MTDSPSTGDLSQLTVFHGDLHSQYALVYAQLPRPTAPGNWVLQGHVAGPRNQFTRTLPAQVELHDLGPGSGLLARAVLPDPCLWGPGQPYLYDVYVELLQAGQVVASRDQLLGMRTLGVWDQQLFHESKPWRMHGAADTSVRTVDWGDWRESGLVRLITEPTADQCLAASEEGVMLIVQLDAVDVGNVDQFTRSCAWLSGFPAVALIAIDAKQDIPAEVLAVTRNIRKAQICSTNSDLTPAPWADLVIYQTSELSRLADQLATCPCPALVQVVGHGQESLDWAATRCRELDAMYSMVPGLAGFVV